MTRLDDYKTVKECPVKLGDVGFINSITMDQDISVQVTRNPFEETNILCWMYQSPDKTSTYWKNISDRDHWKKQIEGNVKPLYMEKSVESYEVEKKDSIEKKLMPRSYHCPKCKRVYTFYYGNYTYCLDCQQHLTDKDLYDEKDDVKPLYMEVGSDAVQ